MRFLTLFVLLGPSLVLFAVVPGCNKEPPRHQKVSPAIPVKPRVIQEETRTALEVKGRNGVLTGKVVYDGEPPPLEPFPKLLQHPDKEGCLKGGPEQISKQNWRVNKENHGLADVVVWLEPPAGKYFSLPEQERKRTGEEVLIDQPHCAFVPHVATLFPFYFDGTKLEPTGQKLAIRNSAPFPHAIQWDPTPQNQMYNQPMGPNTKKEFVLHPQKKPLLVGCGLHSWMYGVLWIFEHPYHAVSGADGTFQIKNVPTDVELTFKAWHESRPKPFEERQMTFKKGENPSVELTLKK